jgi:hypothetical protein
VQGPYFLQLWSFEFQRPKGRTGEGDVIIYQRGPDAQITRIQDVEGVHGMSLAFGASPDPILYDQRVLFFPAAKLLIQIPKGNGRLLLRRVDVEEALEKSGKTYLLVTSEAPLTFQRGQVYRYPMTVKSKQGGVTYRLESGPPGMAVSEKGEVTWLVPAPFAEPEVSVIVSVADHDGNEQFHTFRISLGEGAGGK